MVLLVFGGLVGGVAWILWRSFLEPLVWPDQAPADIPALAIVPTFPKPIPETAVPAVPAYLVDPFVFADARLGIAMLAGWPVVANVRTEVDLWIFRVHGDHWCTVRKATLNDLETIENLKRYARPLLLLRAQ
jgi:hypothetical protein